MFRPGSGFTFSGERTFNQFRPMTGFGQQRPAGAMLGPVGDAPAPSPALAPQPSPQRRPSGEFTDAWFIQKPGARGGMMGWQANPNAKFSNPDIQQVFDLMRLNSGMGLPGETGEQQAELYRQITGRRY